MKKFLLFFLILNLLLPTKIYAKENLTTEEQIKANNKSCLVITTISTITIITILSIYKKKKIKF